MRLNSRAFHFSYVTHTHTHTPLRVWEWIPSPPASGGLFQLFGHAVCIIGSHSYGDHLAELVRRLRGQKHAAFPAACCIAAAPGRRKRLPGGRTPKPWWEPRGWGCSAPRRPAVQRRVESCLFFFSSSETFLQVKTLIM